MAKEKHDDPCMEKILDTIEKIELLIEDNNQNIKDCCNILRALKNKLEKNKKSKAPLLIRKILNKLRWL